MADKQENLVNVLDTSTNQPLQIPESSFQEAIASGRYAPEDKPVPVISPTGQPGTIDPYEAPKALQQGYTYDTQEERTRRAEAKEYNQPIKAGTIGTLSTATFGLSDQALNAIGATSPEELKKLEKYNPISSTLGKATGIVAPILATGGSSALAKGISAGAKGAAKAGSLVEAPVAAALKSAIGTGAERSLAQRVIMKSVPKAAGSAVEGSFYGLGQLMHEDALGDADFNAENALAAAGSGALLGGALGGGVGAVGELASPIASKVGEIFKNRAGKLVSKYADEERAAAELAGISKPNIAKIKERRPEVLTDNINAIRENEALFREAEDVGSFYTKLESKAEKTFDDVSAKMDNAAQHMAEVPKQHSDLYTKIAKSYDDIIQENARLQTNSSELRKLAKIRDSYLKLADEPPKTSFSDLRKDRIALDKQINFDKQNPSLTLQAKRAERQIRENYIEDQLNQLNVSRPGEFENLLQDYKTAKRDYKVASEFGEAARAKSDNVNLMPSLYDLVLGGGGFGIGAGPAGLALLGAKKLLESDLRRRVVVLSGIERANQHVNEKIARSVKDFFSKASKVTKPASTRILLDSGFSIDPDTGTRPKNKDEGLENVRKNIQRFNTNPEVSNDLIISRLSSVNKSAPKTGMKAQETFLKGIQFLNQKAPKSFDSSPLKLRKPRKTSSLEAAKFERYLQAVDAPLTVFDDLKAGTLTREHVEALQTVYPSIYTRLQEASMEYLEKEGQDLSYQKRLTLGLLLDIPADPSLEPDNIAGLQANFAAEGEDNTEVTPTSKSYREANLAEGADSASNAAIRRSETA